MISVNGEIINVTKFPDGTSQVWKLPEYLLKAKSFDIVLNFEDESEVFHLIQLNTLLKYGQVPRPVRLHMPFLPYSRQDKEVSNKSTWALRSFAILVNQMRFAQVTTIDVHSKVASELFDNFRNIEPEEYINGAKSTLSESENSLILAAPDKGAADRYKDYDISIVGYKVRNQLTGYIENYDIEGDPSGKDVLIIDDICDGGMTFKLFARDLLTNGAKSVSLYVTHGIFSKGIQTLKDSGISRIFTKEGEV